MKRLLALFLIICICFSMSACSFRKKPPAPAEPVPTTAVEQAASDAGLPPIADVVESMVLTEEEEAELSDLPSLGDTVYGFVVKEIQAYPVVGAKCILFEHEKTGAGFMYIATSDINRAFDLTFFTRAIDDSGLPHVFEHATLDGSEKYPSDDLFFNLIYQTYNTYLNAQTDQLYTTYPMASLSEAQLLKYADYYTDSCLHPLLMENENIFNEEAWRYRLDSLDGELGIEGTVYSEMRSAMDISSQAHYDWMKACFPGASIGNNSGGDPAHIPEMSWEELKAYHDKYYHPSNCMAYLYGKFEDYTAFLKLLDDAFSGYERRDFSHEDQNYTALTESVVAEIPYPVEESFATDGGSVIYYSFQCPGLKDYLLDELVLNTLTDLLANDSSPLMQRLHKELPSGYFGTYIEPSGPDDMIVFYGMYLNRDDAETFRRIVNETLEEVAETGFQQSLVDSITTSLSYTFKLSRENSNSGISLILGELVPSYASTGDPFYPLNYTAGLQLMDVWNQSGLYQHAIKEWLLVDGVVTVLTTTYAEPGLREELNAAEAERLAAVKASMTEEELLQIINRGDPAWTRFEKQVEAAGHSMDDFFKSYENVVSSSKNQALIELLNDHEDIQYVMESGVVPAELFLQMLQDMLGTDAESDSDASAILLESAEQFLQEIVDSAGSSEATAQLVSELQAVNIKTLPEEVRNYEIHDTTDEEGIRHLTAAAEVDGIGETLFMLDASGLPQEDLHWFALLLPMLGQLETSSHTQEELTGLISRYLFGWNANYSLPTFYKTKEYHPYLNAGFITLDKDMETAYDLVYEILFDTQFTDTEAVSGLIDRALSSARAGINYGSYGLMLYRHLGASEPVYAYSSYISGLDYYAFLYEVSQLMAENPDEVTAKLQEIQQFLHNRANAVTVFAGDPELFEKASELSDRFLQKLDCNPVAPAVYEFEAPAAREALIIDSTVQYNGMIASYENMGLPEYTADLDAVSKVILDAYLIPMLREQYGVYTPMHEYIENGGGYLLTYSDPNITETFDVYGQLSDFLAGYETDQKTLDGYILSSYSYFASPDGELSGAISALYRKICGIPDSQRIEQMEALKALTPEKLREYSSAYAALADKGQIFTVGGSAAIHEHEDLYDLILDPLKDFS